MKKLNLIIIGLLFSFFLPMRASHAIESYQASSVTVLEINSTINPATLDYIRSKIPWQGGQEIAPSGPVANGQLFVLKLNTPGGLVTTTKDILTTFGQSHAPIIIWITPEGASATSAGAIISAGAHFIFMTPGTNIGAATPISLSGDLPGQNSKEEKSGPSNPKTNNPEGSGQSDTRSKAVNDLVALVRDLSEQRGRNAESFAQMISHAKSFTSQEALELNIINGHAYKEAEIFEQLNGKTFKLQGQEYQLSVANPTLINAPMDLSQKLLDLLANPNLAYILFLAGLALIYLEMQAPGGYLAGALGVMCLIVAAMSFQVLPINFGALGLMILGLIFLILETFVTSYGLLTLAAVISLGSGALFLFRSEHGQVDIDRSFIFSTLAGILSCAGAITYLIIRDRKKQSSLNNLYSMIGKHGVVLNRQGEHYQVKIAGEIWRAHGPEELQVGDEVEVNEENKAQLWLKVALAKNKLLQ